MGEDPYARLERATAGLLPPFALLDLDAFWANGADLARRAGGKPIRLASKSLRCRAVQELVLARPDSGFRGTLAFTLPEALWLASHGADDLLVAYPTADVGGLRTLAESMRDALLAAADCGRSSRPAPRVTVMVDSVEQLDLIARAVAPVIRPPIRVCIDVDCSWWPPGRPLRAGAIRLLQSRSARELARRRAAIVAAVDAVVADAGLGVVTDVDTDADAGAALEFVNSGGSGSLERTAAEPAITEVSAGSGLYGPTSSDSYRAFTPRPAALFALPVVRRPVRGVVGGELCERFASLHLLEGDSIVDEVPTYRGEGQCFL
jgi:D-serine deaminase-like pyridoxal phosphate-dependent protein